MRAAAASPDQESLRLSTREAQRDKEAAPLEMTFESDDSRRNRLALMWSDRAPMTHCSVAQALFRTTPAPSSLSHVSTGSQSAASSASSIMGLLRKLYAAQRA